MLRGLGKGAALALLSRLPLGPRAYRHLTREILGTQATHVDKLARVLPVYVEVWQRYLRSLEGLNLWVHEVGHTPFWGLASYLLTGRGGVMTNEEAHLSDQYLTRAVNGVLRAAPNPEEQRRRRVEALRWFDGGARAAVESLGARVMEDVCIDQLPLKPCSVDLAHSGGTLEHHRPGSLRVFLTECHRVLKPGGIASHVFDHRDHLHHADRRLPFLAHLALPDAAYRAALGGSLTYHNRLAPAQVAHVFEEVGFERIAIRRLVLPDRHYLEDGQAMNGAQVGLPRWLLASAHRGISEPDLRTAAAHYLYRKV